MRAFLALLWLVAALTGSPVSRVVNLIRDMRAKIVSDEKAEQQVYDRYACWCETTSARKAKDIADARTKITELADVIQSKKNILSDKADDIEDYMEDLWDNEQDQRDAVYLRQRQNKAFQHEHTESAEALEILEHGLHVLNGHPSSAELVAVAQQLRTAVAVSTKPLAKAQAATVDKFLKGLSLAQTDAHYEPQYHMIESILQNFLDSLKEKMASDEHKEQQQQEEFVEDIDDSMEQLVSDRASVLRRHGLSADASEAMLIAKADLTATQDQLAEDEKFFADTKTACEAKATEWETRQGEREDELQAIDDALEILDSPENRALFGNAYTTFVSISSVPRDAQNKTAIVAALLTKKAHQLKSTVLARAAVAVRSRGNFDDVIASMDTMMDTLTEQEHKDIEDRDTCKVEMKAEREKYEDRQYDVRKLDNELTKLNQKKEKLEAEIGNTQTAIEEHTAMMDQAADERSASHDRFVQSKKDDEDAIDLLQQALVKLEEYYNTTLLQTAELPAQRLTPFITAADVQAPEFKVSKDQAPDAKFSSTSAHKQESKGVLGMLRQITEDLQIEVTDSTKAEETELEEYNKQKADDEETLENLNDRKSDLEGEVSSTDSSISAKETAKEAKETARDSAKEALDNLKPGCDWILGSFDKRRELRKQEMSGLGEAKSLLAGSDAGLHTVTFLQRK